MTTSSRSSRISGFYQWNRPQRIDFLRVWANLTEDETQFLRQGYGLTGELADQMIENVVGLYALPLGIATNFVVNSHEYLIPMVIEEPSVVAACSFAAKLARAGGGFITESTDPLMIGQIQILDLPDVEEAQEKIATERAALLALINDTASSIVKMGGGAKDIETHVFPSTRAGAMVVVHVLYDTRDAMGANAVNTACEMIAPVLEKITGGRVNLRILSNLTDRRLAQATCHIPATELATATLSGAQVVQRIIEAAVFAEVDPYRATTHNKGIMNGIDAVLIATGNDWRAVEAGAHAYAARDGRYTSLTVWQRDESGDLRGSLRMPLAVGIVGGATRVHPIAKIAMRILGVQSARTLAEIITAVGLAQNLAAIRALATEGIQSGHMALHARQIALAAGASGEVVTRIVETMIAEDNIRLDRAKALVEQFGTHMG